MAALSVLRAEVQLRMRDATGRVMTNANTDALINNALEEWVNATEEIRQENAYAMTAYQFDYAAPSDLIKLIKAYWAPTRTELEVVGLNELIDNGGAWTQAGTPQYLALEGTEAALRFRLWPAPPSASGANQLDGSINSTVTTLTLDSTANFRGPSGWVLVESEKILYQNMSSTTMTVARRGMGQTTAATHADNVAVTACDLHVWYAREATALSADGDVPEINARWHKALVYKALAMGMLLEGRHDEAAANEELFFKYLDEAKVAIRRAQASAPIDMRSAY